MCKVIKSFKDINHSKYNMEWNDLFYTLSYNIGRFLSFEDRCICIQTHKCFENIHDTYKYQNWKLNEMNIILKKHKYVKKYKPLLKRLDIEINTDIETQDVLDLAKLTDINKVILFIYNHSECIEKIVNIFEDNCPENIFFGFLNQENITDDIFIKTIQYQVKKQKTEDKVILSIVCNNILEIIKILTNEDIKKIKSIHIKSRALNMLFNHDLSKLKNCKRIICSIEDEFTYKLNDIMTIAYDSYFITMNIKSRDHIIRYYSCTCLEYIYFKSLSAHAAIIGGLIGDLVNIPCKTYIFWDLSLCDPSLYIIIKELTKENKEISFYIHDAPIVSVVGGLIIERKCIENNIKIEMNMSDEYLHYKTKTNVELIELIEDLNIRALFL